MPSVNAPISTYADQLISETWVSWSERMLSSQHETRFTSPRGFQEVCEQVLGSANADHRTRALELFNSGLLVGRLVNPRHGSSRTTIPAGWELVQSDKSPHSRFGYACYAIGKSIAAGNTSPSISHAMSAVAAIILLQGGIRHNGQNILISGLFDHILNSFVKPPSISDSTWNRYVAAGMYCSLSNSSTHDALIDGYIADQPIDTLRLINDSGSVTVRPTNLAAKISTGYSLSDVQPRKASLYLIGNPNHVEPRGLFTLASMHASGLLNHAHRIERNSIISGDVSPFDCVHNIGTDSRPCVLQTLKQAFSCDSTATDEWDKNMQSLYEGVVASLGYLAGHELSGAESGPRVFYAHDVSGEPSLDSNCAIEVDKSSCATKPEVGDLLIVSTATYRIETISDRESKWQVSCAPQHSGGV